MLNGRTEYHVFDRGTVPRDRYCKDMMLPVVHVFGSAIGTYFIFNNDNTHRSADVQQLLESEDITRIHWLAFSLANDLNPIDHVWDALRKHLATQLHPPGNTQN
ncbi:transposable element Tc1 transposase [Trichonephila clavipes]|nr:transposable element Tc1 transposase [Trichonephila clavipes]